MKVSLSNWEVACSRQHYCMLFLTNTIIHLYFYTIRYKQYHITNDNYFCSLQEGSTDILEIVPFIFQSPFMKVFEHMWPDMNRIGTRLEKYCRYPCLPFNSHVTSLNMEFNDKINSVRERKVKQCMLSLISSKSEREI